MMAQLKGYKMPKKHRDNISKALAGKEKSKEHKEAMSTAAQKRDHTIEAKRSWSVYPADEVTLAIVYSNYKSRAKRFKRDFMLTKNEFKKVAQSNCFYCGISPQLRRKYRDGEFIYNGVDRLDNQRGYMLDNIVPCCVHCNVAKNTFTAEEFKAWIIRVYEHARDGYSEDD